jgi:formylglycine-generating enzyme required for sulfatase activity
VASRFLLTTAILCSLALPATPAGDPPKTVNDGYGDFVHVPGGPFRMGDNFRDGESRERPVHTVDVDGSTSASMK